MTARVDELVDNALGTLTVLTFGEATPEQVLAAAEVKALAALGLAVADVAAALREHKAGLPPGPATPAGPVALGDLPELRDFRVQIEPGTGAVLCGEPSNCLGMLADRPRDARGDRRAPPPVPHGVGGGRMSARGIGALGFVGALTMLFAGLKLGGMIGWSWWWVLAPLELYAAAVVVGLVVVVGWAVVLVTLDELDHRRRRRRRHRR